MTPLGIIRSVIKGITQNTTPNELAAGAALGMIAGLVPKANLTAQALLVLIMVFRVNVPLALACAAALIGDQAALHDMGGAAALKGRNVVAVVMNNGGGGIFDHLPLAAVGGELFERGWIAAPGLSLAGLAAAHGLHHARAATRGELAAALVAALRQGGAWLVEAAVDRHTSKGCFDAFQTLARL